MKAKIKKTGEIINLASYATITLDKCDSWGNPIELKPEEVELIPLQDYWQDMFDFENIYRSVPIYKETGLLHMIDSKPIGYRYEKQIGKEFVILLGSDMMEYINKRKDLKEFRQWNRKNLCA